VLELGGSAVLIPYELTWSHEAADPPPDGHRRFYRLNGIRGLPDLLRRIEGAGAF
jgi:putative hydrolase of the HAD superfamily